MIFRTDCRRWQQLLLGRPSRFAVDGGVERRSATGRRRKGSMETAWSNSSIREPGSSCFRLRINLARSNIRFPNGEVSITANAFER